MVIFKAKNWLKNKKLETFYENSNYIDRVVIIKIKNKNIKEKQVLSYTFKSHKHVAISFALVFHYSTEVVTKESKYFRCRCEDFKKLFIKKIEKKLYKVLQLFLNKIWFLHKKTRKNIA